MMKIKDNETFGSYAERLMDQMNTPQELRERVKSNLTEKLCNVMLLKQIEEGKMKIVKVRNSYAYSIK